MEYQSKIDDIIELLIRFRKIIDSHITAIYMVDYFSAIPDSWYEDLESLSYQELLEINQNLFKISNPEARVFFETCINYSPNYPKYENQVEITRVETYGMNPKKCHEAPRLVSYINSKADGHNIKHCIDVGSGQGYLSHLLVTRGGFKVTAIEGNEKNTHESAKRSEIIEEKLGIEGKFDTVSRMVSQDNISEFTAEPCFLVGLHTCGDLASTCFKLFIQDANIKGVFNAGCCYHHITEFISDEVQEDVQEYLKGIEKTYKGRELDDSINADEQSAGYPLSTYIRTHHKHFFLGRVSRTLAISEPYKYHFKDPSLSFKKFQYRAAFQALLQRFFPDYTLIYAVGNRIKNFSSFSIYSLEALKKMKIVHGLTESEIQQFYDLDFKKLEKKSAVFWTIRSALSGPIENLLILDRALYLAEHGSITEIVTIFDKGLSPRNVLVSGFKP